MEFYLNAYSTIRTAVPTPPEFPVTNSRHLTGGEPYFSPDAEEMLEHLGGFMRYALQTGTERAGSYTARLHALGLHIRSTRSQYVFTCDDDSFDLARLTAWAQQANAIFFLPDGTIADPHGRDLLDPASDAAVPHPAAALERSERIRAELADAGFHVAHSLPPVLDAAELVLRDPAEVFDRALVLSTLATWALHLQESGHAHDPGIPEPLLTESEQRTLADPTEQALINLSWGVEAAATLAWALGLLDRDPTSLEPASLDAVNAALAPVGGTAPELHPVELPTLADFLERTFSLRWCAQDSRINEDYQGRPFSGVDTSVLLERHHALAWLTAPLAGYDDVDLST